MIYFWAGFIIGIAFGAVATCCVAMALAQGKNRDDDFKWK